MHPDALEAILIEMYRNRDAAIEAGADDTMLSKLENTIEFMEDELAKARHHRPDECWCGRRAEYVNPATDAGPETAVCAQHMADGYRPL